LAIDPLAWANAAVPLIRKAAETTAIAIFFIFTPHSLDMDREHPGIRNFAPRRDGWR
jgi:hypothetical protein